MNDKNREKLLQIFNDDPFGLLVVKEKKVPYADENTQLVESFQEINRFYEKNKREPQKSSNVIETKLFFRLSSLRKDLEKCEYLKGYDEYSLLNVHQEKKVETIHDIFDDDDLNIFEEINDDIFNIEKLPKRTNMPDYIAVRKKCKNFLRYEHLFQQCQIDLKQGKRKLVKFKNGQQIQEGYFFVLKGVLVYVAEVGEITVENGVKNARLKCIFENGTESDMLLRSLSAGLYKDGRRVTESDDKLYEELFERYSNIENDDMEMGYIYVLKSRSTNMEIASIRNLYKIGFSTTTVEERIKNAQEEPTYLMAPVKIVSIYRCYNMNVNRFESLIHTFFGNTCLEIEISDKNGSIHRPREWFIVPLEVIDRAIKLIINGQIINYIYYNELKEIVLK